jgi:hypothetical protein
MLLRFQKAALRGNYDTGKPSLFNAFEIFDHTGTSHQTSSTVCRECGEPYRKPVQPALNEIQERILQSIREVVRVQTDDAVKNGLTKQQVLDVIKEVLC